MSRGHDIEQARNARWKFWEPICCAAWFGLVWALLLGHTMTLNPDSLEKAARAFCWAHGYVWGSSAVHHRDIIRDVQVAITAYLEAEKEAGRAKSAVGYEGSDRKGWNAIYETSKYLVMHPFPVLILRLSEP